MGLLIVIIAFSLLFILINRYAFKRFAICAQIAKKLRTIRNWIIRFLRICGYVVVGIVLIGIVLRVSLSEKSKKQQKENFANPSITALATSEGHTECELQFKKLSNGHVVEVPEVKDWGDAREYYFAWNSGAESELILTKSGAVSGSCVISKTDGSGFVTLGGKDLGKFEASFAK